MSALMNPRTSPALLIAMAVLGIGGGAALSATRLQTVAAEHKANSLASYRSNLCRILPAAEKVVLGGYYFQPTAAVDGRIEGELLSEGTYICDRYGNTARIERGGYALYIATATDVAELNKTLIQRLSEPTNPDSSEKTQVRRALNLGIYKPPASQPTPKSFFE